MQGSAVDISVDDRVKVESLDSSSDSNVQNELTVTSDSLLSRPVPADTDQSVVLTPKPTELLAANVSSKPADSQPMTEASASGLSSQENTVTRTRSRDVMDFAHLKMKLVQLTGPKEMAAAMPSSTVAAKTKAETEEMKDQCVDSAGSGTPNSELQLSAGRPPVVSCQQVLVGAAPQHGPSVSPDPASAELPVTTIVHRDATGQTKAMSSSDGEPVQPVKPVPVYPITSSHLPQLSVAQLNGNITQHTAGILAPDMLVQRQYAVPTVIDNAPGFVPVHAGDLAAATGIDSVSQLIAAQQPTGTDCSQHASLVALYNNMMMPLPLIWPPAMSLNPFVVATSPLLAAQMMYGAQLVPTPQLPDAYGQMAAADGHVGVPSGYDHQQPGILSGVGQLRDEPVRPTMTSMPSLTSMMMPGVAAARPLVPRPPVAVSGHEHYATSVPRKRPDRPPHLANLEQALIEKLHGHGPRKPAVPAMMPTHSPAASMAWFPLLYGQNAQLTYTPAGVQSPMLSPLYNTDLQLVASSSSFVPDMATSVISSSAALTGTAMHSGRTTPAVGPTAESLPVMGKLLSTQKLPGESAEAFHVTTCVSSVSSGGHVPSARKLQFTVSTVKDDPLLVVDHLQESTTTGCEALVVTSELLSEKPAQNSVSLQNGASATSGVQELGPVLTGKAPVKKGRFRISDVRQDTDTSASSIEVEGSKLPSMAECVVSSNPSDNNSTTMGAVLMAADLCAQQVSSYSYHTASSCPLVD